MLSLEPTNELVLSDLTNPPIETILLKQLILLYRTIINGKNGEEAGIELVRSLWNILSEELRRDIVLEISDLSVFTIRTLYKGKPASKTTAYEVVYKLMELGIVEDTIYKATNPPKDGKTKYAGPKSTFYKIRGYEIQDLDRDPCIRRAQQEHNLTFNESAQTRYDKSRETELINISTVTTNYFKPRIDLLQGPTGIGFIRDYIKKQHPNMDPEMVSDLAIRVRHEVLSEGSA